jgi:hypothetical protein
LLSVAGKFEWLPLHRRDFEWPSSARTYPALRGAAAWKSQAVKRAVNVCDEKLDVLIKGSIFHGTPIVLFEEGTHARTFGQLSELTSTGASRPLKKAADEAERI